MAISIRDAVKNVASVQYDKTNIFYFIILSVILTLLCSFIPEDQNVLFQLNNVILITSYLIIAFFLNGIYITSLNNAINNKEGIISNIINDIKEITSTALKATIGGGIIMLLMTILICIPFAIFTYINPFLGLFVIPLIFFLGILYIGLFLNFSISLKLSDWFFFKKALDIINISKSKFSKYIWKITIITIIGIILTFIPILFFAIIINLLSIFSVINQSMTNTIINIICSIITGITIGIFSIYSIDLTVQYIKEIKPD